MADKRRIFILILTFLSSYLACIPYCFSETYTDTIQQGQQFSDWNKLISSNNSFTLKFFSLGSSLSRYIGIFYEKKYINPPSSNLYHFPEDKAVWVANRDHPITDASGNLQIDVDGKFSISYSEGTIVTLFDSVPIASNVSATLLDSGNLVLQELYPDGSVKQVLWQSFDYPTDTLLPGMKLGVDFKSGRNWSLTSWVSDLLPASGPFKTTVDPNGTSQFQLVILNRGNIYWFSGSWQDGGFQNMDMSSLTRYLRLNYISNETDKYLTHSTVGETVLPFTMYPDGRLLLIGCRLQWQGSGCVEIEDQKSECRTLESGFSWKTGYLNGNFYEFGAISNLTLYDCKNICWKNCSCTAFTYATADRRGCTIYNPEFSHSFYRREYYLVGSDYYYGETQKRRNRLIKKWSILVIIGVVSIAALVLFCCLLQRKLKMVNHYMCFLFYINKLGKDKKTKNMILDDLREDGNSAPSTKHDNENNRKKGKKRNRELHFFSFQSISVATNNFSSTNKLGQGGFGAVYKGRLFDGQEVAVKRLSRSSRQGAKEFKNEIILIAKLQHTNLVRLIGCCIEKEENILVYEYMPNNSLDFFLFDPSRKELLPWKNRLAIIDGIAQGLLYLHKYSRLRIIHRDLKASNVLLDDCFKPKISDFGLAKLFGINESEANTSRVVGTRGYMSPEYMIDGTVSMKTDVFSFGVLLLEIVSSKMNNNSYDSEHPLNLIGLAWELWKEGRGLELMDPTLKESCSPDEVMRCIHVGLLCVQDHAADRPSMSEVVYMFTNQNMQLPEPKRPAFFIDRHGTEEIKEDKLEKGSINKLSISVIEAR